MKKIIILFFLILQFSISYAETVSKVIIKGNARISEETIIVYGEIDLNKDFTQNTTNLILKNLYQTNFFEDIQVQIKSGVLTINVKEYPSINSLELKGEDTDKIKEAILERLQSKEKGSFIKNNIAKDVELIKKLYASLGYNFANVTSKIEKFSENRLNLVFFIDKGNKTKISNIYFIGDKKVKERRLRDIIVSEEHKFWKVLSKNTNLNEGNIQLDKRLLTNYYKSIGYYDVQVLSSNAEITEDNTSLTYNINAGIRYKITKISTNVDPVLDKNIFLPLNKEFRKVAGKYYSPFLIKKMLDELDLLIARNDLQFIQHSVNEIIENDGIEVSIEVFEGKKLLVERINVKGNTVTNETVVRAELLLDEGDPFSSLKLDQSVSKLKSRNIFGNVKKEVFEGSSKDLRVIDISVEEKPTGEISAGAGIGTNGASFSFAIKENNWLGKGMEVSSYLDVNQETIKGSLQVTDPNYNYSGNALNYSITSSTNDKPTSGYKNNIISAGLGTGFEQYKDIYLSPALNITYDDLIVDSTASAALKKQAGAYSDLSLNYAVQYDGRDRAFMPTSGFITSFAQVLPIYSDAASIENSYKISKYKAFGPDVIGAMKFYASAVNSISSEDVRLNKRIFLSSNRLRGFEKGKVGPKDGNDYIGGNYATALNFESTLPNLLPESTKADVNLFLDFGNVWEIDYNSAIDKSNKIRSSAGAALNWLSPVGPMSFVLSQNISKATTDVTESFNFRLGTTF